MNKDLYIELLEEYVADLRTVNILGSKIDQQRVDHLRDDINDIQADWAADHVATIKLHEADCAFSDMTLQEFERDIEVLTARGEKYDGIIRELKKEKYDMGMELEQLKKEKARIFDELTTARMQLNSIAEAQQ